VVLVALAAASGAASAQNVGGHVLDADNRNAVGAATVFLMDLDGREIGSAFSALDGAFTLRAPAGSYRIVVRHVAYQELVTPVVTIERGPLTVELLLDTAPRMFDMITVTDSRPLAAERGGHYRRRSIGAGRFVSRADIDRRQPQFVTDMLEGIPGIVVRNGDFRVTSYAVQRGCVPTIVLDNVAIRKRGQELGIRLDDMVRPEYIEAIEVYARGSGLPAQFGGRESPCGAIIIWTRPRPYGASGS
jgi:hypothetical protein